MLAEDIHTQAERLSEYPLEELWEMADKLEIKLEKESREAEQLEKKLRVIKQELKEYKEASKKEGKKFEETPLYDHIMDFIEDVEEMLENVRIKRGEYIAFLLALKKKMKEKKKAGKELGRFKKE